MGPRHCSQFIDIGGFGDAHGGFFARVPLSVRVRVVQQVRTELLPSEVHVRCDVSRLGSRVIPGS